MEKNVVYCKLITFASHCYFMEHKRHYVGLSEQEVEESRQNPERNIITPPLQTPLWKRFIANLTTRHLSYFLLLVSSLSVYHSTNNILVLTKERKFLNR